MTTATKTQRNISGTIADVAFKYVGTGANKGKEYAEVSLLETGKDYPTKCRVFDEALVTRFKGATKGTVIGLAIEESEGAINPRSKKPYTNRDIVAIVPADAAASQAQTPTPAPAPAPERPSDAARMYPTIDRPSLNPNADKYSAQAELYSQWHMNRRTALMQATKAVLHDTPTSGDVIDLDDVIFTAADRRFAWLQGTVQEPDDEAS